jgi:hypothetical protein
VVAYDGQISLRRTDTFQCTNKLEMEVEATQIQKREEGESDNCVLVTFYFLVTSSSEEVTNYVILFEYGTYRTHARAHTQHTTHAADTRLVLRATPDPGCDSCGGYEDGCGCHPSGSPSTCSCEAVSYRGYDSTGLDRSLLVRVCAGVCCMRLPTHAIIVRCVRR